MSRLNQIIALALLLGTANSYASLSSCESAVTEKTWFACKNHGLSYSLQVFRTPGTRDQYFMTISDLHQTGVGTQDNSNTTYTMADLTCKDGVLSSKSETVIDAITGTESKLSVQTIIKDADHYFAKITRGTMSEVLCTRMFTY